MVALVREFLTLLLLVVANGAFVITETSILSARKSRLQQASEEGDTRAAAALALAGSPNLFLSTVQTGITLVGILAGAYGEAAFSDRLQEQLQRLPYLAGHARGLSLGLVVLCVTYVSLVFGELVPKRLALHSPEKIASAVALPVRLLSVATAPLVRLLSASTDLVLLLFGVRAHRETPVTEEEIRVMIDQGTRAGVFEEAEQNMVERVFRLGDRRVNALMTPRTDISWIDLDGEPAEIRREITEAPYSRLPVAHGSLDDVLGVVHVKDLLVQLLANRPLDLGAALSPPLFVPETMRALTLMEHFKQSGHHAALVTDEFGGIQGLVTFSDVLQAIIGDLSPAHEETPQAARREDGSWLVDGLLPIDEFKSVFDLEALPEEAGGNYLTLGGLVVMRIGHIPATAEHFHWNGLRFEVVDMDGHRVDKVLVTRDAESQGGAP